MIVAVNLEPNERPDHIYLLPDKVSSDEFSISGPTFLKIYKCADKVVTVSQTIVEMDLDTVNQRELVDHCWVKNSKLLVVAYSDNQIQLYKYNTLLSSFTIQLSSQDIMNYLNKN